MSPDRLERFYEIMAERNIPLCWTIVRTDKVYTGRKFRTRREEIHVSHNSISAKMEYNRLLSARNNGLSLKNLKLIPRRQRFGEGMYT